MNKIASKKKTVKLKIIILSTVFISILVIILTAFLIMDIVCKNKAEAGITDKDKQVIGTINKQSIYKYELEYFVKKEENILKPTLLKGKTSTNQINWNISLNGQKASEIVKKNALSDLKNLKVILAKAKENGIALNENEKETVLKKADDDINIGDNTYKQNVLASFGVQSVSAYTDMLLKEMLYEKYKNIITKDLIITQNELKDYYNKNINTFRQQDYHALNVVLLKDIGTSDTVLEQILKGTLSLEKAGALYGDSAFSKQFGIKLEPEDGELYYWLLNCLNEMKVKEGKPAKVIMNLNCYIIIETGISRGVSLTFAQAEDQIRQKIEDEKIYSQIDAWSTSFVIKFSSDKINKLITF